MGCPRLSARHEADHSLPSNVDIKTVWNYSSLPARFKSVPRNCSLEHSSENTHDSRVVDGVVASVAVPHKFIHVNPLFFLTPRMGRLKLLALIEVLYPLW